MKMKITFFLLTLGFMISSLCVAQSDSNETLESNSLRTNQEKRILDIFCG